MIRICTLNDFLELYEILKSKKKISGANRSLTIDFNRFSQWFGAENRRCFAFVVDEQIVSFLLTKRSSFDSHWIVEMIASRRVCNIFDDKKYGHSKLYDAAVAYWEAKGLTRFMYIQPLTFATFNSKVRQNSKALQEYSTADMMVVPKNTAPDDPIVRELTMNLTFPNDMIVRVRSK
jgi:hypothetical protein